MNSNIEPMNKSESWACFFIPNLTVLLTSLTYLIMKWRNNWNKQNYCYRCFLLLRAFWIPAFADGDYLSEPVIEETPAIDAPEEELIWQEGLNKSNLISSNLFLIW